MTHPDTIRADTYARELNEAEEELRAQQSMIDGYIDLVKVLRRQLDDLDGLLDTAREERDEARAIIARIERECLAEHVWNDRGQMVGDFLLFVRTVDKLCSGWVPASGAGSAEGQPR